MQMFIKHLSLFLFFIVGTTAFANNTQNINFELTANQTVLDKVLANLWHEIDYEHDITTKNDINILNDSMSFKLTQGKVILGKKPEPLFNLEIADKNQLIINWKLHNLTADAKAKIRFKFKKFGIQITHDEYFVIKASQVNNSQSELNINFNNSFNFNIIKNTGFQFKTIDIKPQNGIGSTLRYIFDNIFSKQAVNRYITEQVNKSLQKWINKDQFIKQVELTVNNQVNELKNKVIKLNQAASHIKVNIRKFDFNQDSIFINLKPTFVYDQLKVHPCAQLMHRPYTKDYVSVPHKLIETMINNYATYEIWEEEKLIEPLFCIGYKNYDQAGNPLGEHAELSFLGKKINFKYWVAPSSAPRYTYYPQQQLIRIDLSLIIKIISENYPIIKLNGDQLRARLSAYYNLEFVPTQGLNLVFNSFDITSITGRVKVKWNRYTPSIRVPLSTIMAQLEQAINDQANDDYKVTNLFSNEINFLGDLKLLIEDYQMLKSEHKVIFSTQ